MATRQAISRISERIDELAARLGVSPRPMYCVCETIEEGRQAVARHLAEHPRDSERGNPHHRDGHIEWKVRRDRAGVTAMSRSTPRAARDQTFQNRRRTVTSPASTRTPVSRPQACGGL